MKNYYDRTWKIGELANMFDINVQLLRHYDKEGLLVPEIRNPDNNWRSYKYDQIYPLGMIRFLRQLDCSLDEIGDFMPERDPQKTEKYLAERMEVMRAKYKKLIRIENMMNDRIGMVKHELAYAMFDQVFVTSEDDILYVEIGGIEDIFVNELFYLYPTLVFYKGDSQTFAIRVPEKDKGYFDKFADRMHVMAQDEYLVGYHKGPHQKLRDTFERMHAAAPGILEEGCRLDDTQLCMDIVDQFIEANKENFITKVMIKVISE